MTQGAGALETPKTGQTRTVDMSEQLARTLRRLEIDRMVEKLRLGWQEMSRWVFCTEVGTPLTAPSIGAPTERPREPSRTP